MGGVGQHCAVGLKLNSFLYRGLHLGLPRGHHVYFTVYSIVFSIVFFIVFSIVYCDLTVRKLDRV